MYFVDKGDGKVTIDLGPKTVSRQELELLIGHGDSLRYFVGLADIYNLIKICQTDIEELSSTQLGELCLEKGEITLPTKNIHPTFSKVLINWLNMFYILTERLDRLYGRNKVPKKLNGTTNPERNNHKFITCRYFDNHEVYAILWELRRYAVHYGLPSTSIIANSENGKGKLCYIVNLSRMYTKFSAKSRRSAQQKYGDNVELSRILGDATAMFDLLYADVLNDNKSDILKILNDVQKFSMNHEGIIVYPWYLKAENHDMNASIRNSSWSDTVNKPLRNILRMYQSINCKLM